MIELYALEKRYIDKYTRIYKKVPFIIPDNFFINGELIYCKYSEFNIKTIGILELVPQIIFSEKLDCYLKFIGFDNELKNNNFPLILYTTQDGNKNNVTRYSIKYLNNLL